MLTKKLYHLFFILIFFSFSCVNAQTSNSYKTPLLVKNLNAWVGKPVSELISHPKFGVPQDKMTVGDQTLLTYRENLGVEGQIKNNLTINILCKRIFIYNNKNIITEVKEEGNCRDNQNYLPHK